MRRRLLLLTLTALPALPASLRAQTTVQQSRPIYRCGNQVSDRPCGDADGQAQRFDEPSRADREAASARARDDAREAERLARERRRREAQTGRGAARLDAARAPEPAASEAKERKAGAAKPKKKKRE